MPSNIFGILYRQGQRSWYALINAEHQGQAIETLWKAHLAGSPLLDGHADLTIEQITGIANSAELPYPGAIPKHPALLAVIRLQWKTP